MAKAGKKVALDFTNVKDSGGKFRKTRQEAGDYPGKITDVETVPKKNKSGDQWLFTIKVGSGIYPYYCGFEENVLWKIRNLFVAAGVNVPKKRVMVDPNKVVGKTVGVTLEDDEYDGKQQSTIASIFPPSELEDSDTEDDDADDDDAEEETSDDDTEEEEDEEEEPEPPKKKKKKKAKASDDMEELDIEDI